MLSQESIMKTIQAYEEGVDRLVEAVQGLTKEQMDIPRAPGKWTIRQIVAHLADTEMVYTHRMRKVIAEGGGALTGFDQDQWVAELFAAEMPVSAAIGLIQSLRAYHVLVLRRLPLEAYERQGQHETDGSVTAFALLEKITNHLVHHVSQIDEIRTRIVKS